MNLSDIKKLIRLFEGSKVSELEVEQEGLRVHLKKGGGAQHEVIHVPAAAHVPAPSAAPVSAETSSAAAQPAVSGAKSEGHIITSPMVGTFFRSPSPTTPPFVDEGDLVRDGQVLCIIEAMKLMNEIESDVQGKIVKIFPENGKPVEFGEPLIEIAVS